MYTIDAVARKINAMGALAFITMISDPRFSKPIVSDLEKLHIIVNGVPNKKLIHQLAA